MIHNDHDYIGHVVSILKKSDFITYTTYWRKCYSTVMSPVTNVQWFYNIVINSQFSFRNNLKITILLFYRFFDNVEVSEKKNYKLKKFKNLKKNRILNDFVYFFNQIFRKFVKKTFCDIKYNALNNQIQIDKKDFRYRFIYFFDFCQRDECFWSRFSSQIFVHVMDFFSKTRFHAFDFEIDVQFFNQIFQNLEQIEKCWF